MQTDTMSKENCKEDGHEYSLDEMGVLDVRQSLAEKLSSNELTMYEEWRHGFAEWAFTQGKKPHMGEGYAKSSMQNIVGRVDAFYEWLHDESEFTTDVTAEQVEQYWWELLENDNKVGSNRRNINNVSLVLDYRDIEWTIPNSEEVYDAIAKEQSTRVGDHLSAKELKQIKTAALSRYSFPDESELSAEEADELAAHLAQRLEKPKGDLTQSDWEKASSWKIASLVYVSCDVGLRPIEVERSKMSWLRLNGEDDSSIQIPSTESAKTANENWESYLSPETVRILNLWLAERSKRPEYWYVDESGVRRERDAIWLTRDGNPYCSRSLRHVMKELQEEAGLDVDQRENGWYTLRRGVGTQIANDQSFPTLKNQLRVSSSGAAMRYVMSSESGARDWFDNR